MTKRIVLLSLIPLSLILMAVFSMNRFSKTNTADQFERITIAEGMTIKHLLEVSGRQEMLNGVEGEEGIKKFLDTLFLNESIIYIGFFKDEELTYLLSRFEGYFPIVEDEEEFQIIDSPIGRIFDIKSTFNGNNGNNGAGKPLSQSTQYKLHIGYNYDFLTEFERMANRNFTVIAGIFSGLILLITVLIIYFDRKFYKAQWSLEREKQEKERFRELSLLTSEIAHEIKNPLNSIYLSFNALEAYLGQEEDAVFYRDAIKGEIKRVSGIIQSYSDLSRELHPDVEAVDLDHFFKEFQLVLARELEKNQTALTVTPVDGVVFDTDPALLKQVLLNLVKNALEAGAMSIEISLETDKRGLSIRVTDNGKGIAEEHAHHLFKPYVSTKTKGMGLGLYIVMKIIKAFEGSIRLTHHEPGRTQFQIHLPKHAQSRPQSTTP